MKHSLNASDIKKNNQRLILDAVFSSTTTSRTQLARELSLSKPAISDNLAKLLEEGIVEEIGESSVGPAGGRKKILLQFNAMHKLIISINLNFSNPVFVLGNLNGDVINAFDVSIAEGTSVSSCMELVCNGIRVLLQSVGANADKVYCIAVAAPGVFNDSGELVAYNTGCGGPAWWQLNLKKRLTDTFGLPVIVYNDVKAAALGEWVQGSGNRESDLFYISAGLGIGAGIILNGAPYLGNRFNAGEIFDYIDSPASDSPYLEDTICLEYLKEQCSRISPSPFPADEPLSLDAILRAYSDGHSEVEAIVDDICRRLAVITYNYINFISVQNVIFGGEYAPFGTHFIKHLSSLFARSTRPMPSIKITALGKFAGIQGMFYLARQHYFQEICFQ